jgi:hypothetical protein
MSEFKFPTEEIELPSKGLVYPKDNPLSSGKVEIKYMTAKEEDILTNQSYIQKGTVLDKLLESVIIDPKTNIDDIIVGDKNALLIATRILGYGKKYEFRSNGQTHTADLTEIENKQFDISGIESGKNEFTYKIERTGDVITYKILTGKDDKQIQKEIAGLKKLNKEGSFDLTTRLKYMIVSINGESDRKDIRNFVDNQFLAIDSRAFRDHVRDTQPDVDLTISTDRGEEVKIPIGISFFWPDAG